MGLTHKYTIVCDEVRIENNNKLFVIGMYGANVITLPQIPFVLPSLTFLQVFESNQPLGQVGFRASLSLLDKGAQMAQAMGMINIARPGQGLSVIGFRNIQFNAVGSYVFSILIEGQVEIPVNFDVILSPPPINPQPLS